MPLRDVELVTEDQHVKWVNRMLKLFNGYVSVVVEVPFGGDAEDSDPLSDGRHFRYLGIPRKSSEVMNTVLVMEDSSVQLTEDR